MIIVISKWDIENSTNSTKGEFAGDFWFECASFEQWKRTQLDLRDVSLAESSRVINGVHIATWTTTDAVYDVVAGDTWEDLIKAAMNQIRVGNVPLQLTSRMTHETWAMIKAAPPMELVMSTARKMC